MCITLSRVTSLSFSLPLTLEVILVETLLMMVVLVVLLAVSIAVWDDVLLLGLVVIDGLDLLLAVEVWLAFYDLLLSTLLVLLTGDCTAG